MGCTIGGRAYLPAGENSNDCTSCDVVPLPRAAFGWIVNEGFDCTLRILDPHVWYVTKVAWVGSDLHLHTLEI